MSAWVDHVVLLVAGLFALGVVGGLARFFCRRDPVTAYRAFMTLVLLALLLPVVQVMAELRGPALPAVESFVQRLRLQQPELAPRTDVRDESAAPARRPATEPSVEDAPTGTVPEGPPQLVSSASEPAPRGRVGDLLLAGYLVGLCGVFGRGMLRARAMARVVRGARLVSDPDVHHAWQRLTAESRLRGRVLLRELPGLTSFACWGLRRPTVFVPPRTEVETKDVVEWALRHELVHLERRDPLACALQAVFFGVFWFHPAAWWIARQASVTREASCDRIVVAGTGKPRSYALALLAYAARPTRGAERGAVVSAAPLTWLRSRSQLRRRIEMLSVPASSRGARLVRTVALLAMISALSVGHGVVAAHLDPSSAGGVEPQEAKEPPTLRAGSGVLEVLVLAPTTRAYRGVTLDPARPPVVFAGSQPRSTAELRRWIQERIGAAPRTQAWKLAVRSERRAHFTWVTSVMNAVMTGEPKLGVTSASIETIDLAATVVRPLAGPPPSELDRKFARLTAKDAGKRYAALIEISNHPPSAHVDKAIASRLQDSEAFVRVAAVQCLRKRESRRYLPDILDRMTDRDYFVRVAASSTFQALTGHFPLYSVDWSADERQRGHAALVKWWEANRSRFGH